MPEKAIVLSAGQGTRLSPLTDTRPKCLVTIDGRTILEWQLRALASSGVRRAVVVTGFGADQVETAVLAMQLSYIDVRTLFNPFYAVADNIASCWSAVGEMDDDCLLLNGDTLFEPAVVERVRAAAAGPISVTIDRKQRYDADDMKVKLAGRQLAAIGKTLPLEDVDGESIGLIRFSKDGAYLFERELDKVLRRPDGLGLWYLSVIHDLAQRGHVSVTAIDGLNWSEVDFPHDLRRAGETVRAWQPAARRATAAA